MKLIWLLLIAVLPCQAAMTVTRELVAPEHVVPGQPVRVSVTFWTDSWFNPPPEWPVFPGDNGALLTTQLPNQLLTRREGSTSWSGVRMERQISAWDNGELRLPPIEVTLTGAGQAPVTVSLPELKKTVSWPQDVHQPDRFLPASQLTLTQKINLYRSGKGDVLRAGDVIERVVTVQAKGVLPVQIPPLVYAIPGTHTQRLTPVNSQLSSGRGEFEGGQRVETLRYLPVETGTVTLPPIKLRWWDTTHQQWQTAELPGSQYHLAASGTAGAESALKGDAGTSRGVIPIGIVGVAILSALLFIFRRALLRGVRYVFRQWHRFWHPISLPGQIPENRSQQ